MAVKSISKQSTFAYRFGFAAIALLLMLIRLLFIHQNIWPINGDEAQYWGWAKHLAFGYYSKPPLLAWLVAITSHLFGDGAIGLRSGSVFCHLTTAIFLYLLGKRFYNEKTGFWTSVSYLTLPGVVFSSTIISTDAPLILFWAGCVYFFACGLEDNLAYQWLLTGVMLGFALLSKYAAIFLPISAILYLLINKKYRYHLKNLWFYLAGFVAVIILLPNVLWNIHHAFVSIQAVKENADLQTNFFHPENLLMFLLAQIAVIGPVYFISYIVLLSKFNLIKKQDPYQTLWFAFVWPLFSLMSFEAFIARAHGNWAVPVYVTVLIALTAYLVKEKKMIWIYLAIIINLLLQIGFFKLPALVRYVGIKLPLSTSTLNWPSIGKQIRQQIIAHNNSSLIIDNRMLFAMTMYYTKQPLNQLYKWNPSNQIHDQYDMVSHLQNKIGNNFILVTYYQPTACIINSFSKITPLQTIVEPTLDGRQEQLYLFYLQDFQGYSTACN